MSNELFNQILDGIIRGTLGAICTGFCILCLIGIWKWFFGVMRNGLFYLFPNLKAWAENRKQRRKKVKSNGNNNDSESTGRLDHRDQLL